MEGLEHLILFLKESVMTDPANLDVRLVIGKVGAYLNPGNQGQCTTNATRCGFQCERCEQQGPCEVPPNLLERNGSPNWPVSKQG